ncbi:DNA protecting protein DprA [uncultured Desulfobacterium sp.]|uniref:DNA protecting protein DprA n=1 Tax=uncultured Desulfobacterium sp. TaxID=201089 RepID=A0A445MQM8_9BACT|nr:DNA protecting protein DprA [uncultured Desulfobacterium sp.]
MKASSNEILSWVGLYLIPGLGNRAFGNLIARFGSAKAVFDAGFSGLVGVEGVREEVARRIVARQYTCDPEKEIRRVEDNGARIITYLDPSYPRLLKEIHSPPMLLYIKGKNIPANQTLIAAVGSRNPTHYGTRAAENIAFGLAKRGVGVVSGMAKGIDSAAHVGCMRANGFTIAVIGTGIDQVYPASNKGLAEQITESGAVISEFPIGSPPEPKNFPIRNRTISGLSRGVVVVEATRNSGSLITASLALEQGRDVFAVPGSIDSFKSTGAHFLIKRGAKLVENADDILDEFGYNDSPHQEKFIFGNKEGNMPEMNEPEKKIYELLGEYPLHIDEIVRMGNMGTGEVSSALMGLELKGLVRQLMGKMFVR